MEQQELNEYRKAGKIAKQVVSYAKNITKKEYLMLELAEEIEQKIHDLKAKPAFPVDICCNEIAAHYSPLANDKNILNGLVKIDIGISIEGYIVDTAFSLDLSEDKKHARLIKASEEALKNSILLIKRKKNETQAREIGETIRNTIVDTGFLPVFNLSGHRIDRYKIHAGLSIPNFDNGNLTELKEGIYAIEPFATNGEGYVVDAGISEVYMLKEKKSVRDSEARKMLEFIEQEYKTMPFALRWIEKRFNKARFSLSLLEKNSCLHHFRYLIEKTKMPVSQAEHTLLVTEKKVEVLTGEE